MPAGDGMGQATSMGWALSPGAWAGKHGALWEPGLGPRALLPLG